MVEEFVMTTTIGLGLLGVLIALSLVGIVSVIYFCVRYYNRQRAIERVATTLNALDMTFAHDVENPLKQLDDALNLMIRMRVSWSDLKERYQLPFWSVDQGFEHARKRIITEGNTILSTISRLSDHHLVLLDDKFQRFETLLWWISGMYSVERQYRHFQMATDFPCEEYIYNQLKTDKLAERIRYNYKHFLDSQDVIDAHDFWGNILEDIDEVGFNKGGLSPEELEVAADKLRVNFSKVRAMKVEA